MCSFVVELTQPNNLKALTVIRVVTLSDYVATLDATFL
jgi:hypothetical protein